MKKGIRKALQIGRSDFTIILSETKWSIIELKIIS